MGGGWYLSVCMIQVASRLASGVIQTRIEIENESKLYGDLVAVARKVSCSPATRDKRFTLVLTSVVLVPLVFLTGLIPNCRANCKNTSIVKNTPSKKPAKTSLPRLCKSLTSEFKNRSAPKNKPTKRWTSLSSCTLDSSPCVPSSRKRTIVSDFQGSNRSKIRNSKT